MAISSVEQSPTAANQVRSFRSSYATKRLFLGLSQTPNAHLVNPRLGRNDILEKSSPTTESFQEGNFQKRFNKAYNTLTQKVGLKERMDFDVYRRQTKLERYRAHEELERRRNKVYLSAEKE